MSKHDRMKGKHDSHTNEIALHPNKLDLEGKILMSTAEANIFQPRSYDLFHQPDDLLFDYANHIIYNVEYKCSNKQKHKAIKQLRETAGVLRTMFRNYDVVNLYVHNEYVKEVIE